MNVDILSYLKQPLFFVLFFLKVHFTPSAEPNAGLELMTLLSRPELRSRVGHLTS